ncbi:hypothetical protein L915_08295, partial [Phytophthora nicotianae]
RPAIGKSFRGRGRFKPKPEGKRVENRTCNSARRPTALRQTALSGRSKKARRETSNH